MNSLDKLFFLLPLKGHFHQIFIKSFRNVVFEIQFIPICHRVLLVYDFETKLFGLFNLIDVLIFCLNFYRKG